MALEPETTKVADATVTGASETKSETTEASATAGASAMVPPWQNIGYEILETILKNAEQIKVELAKEQISQNRIDAAARAIAQRKAIEAMHEGIEHARDCAKSATITGEEMLYELFPAFCRKSSNCKQPKKAKSTSKKVPKKAPKKAPCQPPDQAAKKGGVNA